ncbi:MAG: N-acetylmuramoyl-L-alanine amidase [Ectothiorhodospiraceae bacterium]|nr:N-acetylmuramoyl-L-alanine amidase [Ectothiorhodospiraceae bacterium]
MDDPIQREHRRRFLLHALRLSGATAAAWLAPQTVLAGPAVVGAVRHASNGNLTRVVFDIDGPVQHNLFTLNGPDRLVVDLANARVAGALDLGDTRGGVLNGLRHAARNGGDLRLVLDLRSGVSFRSSVLAPESANAAYRLVIDLETTGSTAVQAAAPAATAVVTPPEKLREVVVAIDAGHGGKDPGAVGPNGTREKDIVLAVARRLATLVQREHGMRAVLIRDADVFLPLRARIQKAREHQADLFVSIHADAHKDKRASGSSVYILSSRGATSEHARWLAERENAADLVGGVSLDDKDDLLASVLLDLSQTATIEASSILADTLIGELHRVGKVRSKKVEQAGFAVLRSPDIPSVLVETAYITNPAEERRLRTTAFQQSMAAALMGGLRDYFRTYAPPGTILAEARDGRHVIRNGETLSAIASQYRVSVNALRSHNGLDSDTIRTGQVLMIPRQES